MDGEGGTEGEWEGREGVVFGKLCDTSVAHYGTVESEWEWGGYTHRAIAA